MVVPFRTLNGNVSWHPANHRGSRFAAGAAKGGPKGSGWPGELLLQTCFSQLCCFALAAASDRSRRSPNRRLPEGFGRFPGETLLSFTFLRPQGLAGTVPTFPQ